MPTITNSTYKNDYLSKWTCDGQTTQLIYNDFVVRTLRNTYLTKESRVKPSNLLQNMTARPRQFNETFDAGQRIKEQVHSRSCRWPGESGWYRTLTKKEQLYYTELGAHNITLDTGDWATGLRLQVKSLKVSLGEDLAEYRQTASLFKSAASGVSDAWKYWKGKKRSRRKLTPCAVPAADLIYSFGVAPLIGTVYDSVEKLRSTLDQPTLVKVVQSATKNTTVNGDYSGGTRKVKGKRSSRAEVYLSFSRGSAQFTLGNPLEIAWELVPYSFVFDYMIPVGNMLKALDALTGVNGIYGTVTHRDSISGQYWIDEDPAWTTVLNKPCTSTLKGHSRDLVSSIPMPSYPRWDPSASWHKLRHAVELLYVSRRC